MSILPRPSFASDSMLCDRVVPGYGYRRGALPRRPCGISGTVTHTTGTDPIVRWRKLSASERAKRTPFDAALDIYVSGKCGDNGPHWLVGQRGELVQLVPERYTAYTVGSSGGWRYTRADWFGGPLGRRRYQWWIDRWPLLGTPALLCGGAIWGAIGVPRCNPHVVAIEVVPDEASPNTGAWSSAAWDVYARLVWDIARRNKLPLVPEIHVSHSDAHPLSRTTLSGKPWDPAPGQWTWGALELELRRLGAFGQ